MKKDLTPPSKFDNLSKLKNIPVPKQGQLACSTAFSFSLPLMRTKEKEKVERLIIYYDSPQQIEDIADAIKKGIKSYK